MRRGSFLLLGLLACLPGAAAAQALPRVLIRTELGPIEVPVVLRRAGGRSS